MLAYHASLIRVKVNTPWSAACTCGIHIGHQTGRRMGTVRQQQMTHLMGYHMAQQL
jgi:hypothetical protein